MRKGTPPKVADNKAKVFILPSLKQRLFSEFERRPIRSLVQVHRGVSSEQVQDIVREGIQELREQGAVGPTFRRDGFGKPIRREVVSMPTRFREAA